MSTHLIGEEELKAKLLELSSKMNASQGVATAAAGEVIARSLASHAPRDTGATAASAGVVMEGETAYAGVRTPYARFTNYGTVYITPMHWADTAYSESERSAIEAMELIFREALRI